MSSKIRSFSASIPPKGQPQQQKQGGTDVTWIQQSLKTLGYDPGPIDGIMGAKTIAAIKKFQQDTPDPGTLGPMKADGIVGPRTKAALEAGLRGSQPQPVQPTQPQPQPQPQPKKDLPSTPKDLSDHAKDAGNDVVDHAKDDANKLIDHATDDAKELVDHTEKAAENYLDKKKKAAEDWIDDQLGS